jgi:hypothetical protein
MNDAGATLARVAADMRAGQTQIFTQVMDEKRARLDVSGDGLPVHRH